MNAKASKKINELIQDIPGIEKELKVVFQRLDNEEYVNISNIKNRKLRKSLKAIFHALKLHASSKDKYNYRKSSKNDKTILLQLLAQCIQASKVRVHFKMFIVLRYVH